MDFTPELLQDNTAKIDPRFTNLVDQSLMGVAILHGMNLRVSFANERIIQMWGDGKDISGKTVDEAFLPITSQLPQVFSEVFVTGIPYYGYETRIQFTRNGKSQEAYFNFICQPYREFETITGLTLLVTDVTEAVIAKKRVEESERQFRNVLLDSPGIFAILKGYPEMILTFGNQPLFQSWGKGSDIIGKPLLEILPELKDQPFPDILRQVYETGVAHYGDEAKAVLIQNGKPVEAYYKYVYQPITGSDGKVSGITIMANDITSQVLSRRAVEEQNHVLEMITSGAPLPDALDFLITSLQRQSNNGMIGSVLLVDDKGLLRHESAPSLAPSYVEAIDTLKISIGERAFRTATPHQEMAAAPDIITKIKSLASQHGLHSCWSAPILSGENVLGIFFLYYKEVHGPSEKDRKIVDFALRTARLAIERKRAEEALQRAKDDSEKRKRLYETITASTPDLIYVFDLNYRFTYANEALLKMWGRSWEDSIGHRLLDLGYEPWHAEMHEREIDYVVATKQSIRGEVSFPHAITGRRIYDYIFVPVFNEQGNVEAVAGTTRDITELKQAQDALKDLAADLERRVMERTRALQQSNDNLQQFAHVASHDLKEPVRKIKTYGYRLQDELKNSSESAKKYTDKILLSAQRMSTMIDGVLTYSTVNATQKHFTTVDLNKVFDEIQTDLEIVIQQKQARITVEPLPSIEAVDVLIHQLFYNLLNNALKFSKPDVKPSIVIQSATVEQHGVECAQITVSDNGIGFDPEFNEKIFQSFTRLNSKSVYDGTGLGLSLCRNIVERHGGKIWANGKENIGATFSIILPMKQNASETSVFI